MKKTYTIQRQRSNIDTCHNIFSLEHLRKGEALGAMLFAKVVYNSPYDYRCVCDQTNEVIDEHLASTIHLN